MFRRHLLFQNLILKFRFKGIDKFPFMSCPICLENIKGPKNRVVTKCGHAFHSVCLFENIAHNGFACPYCRTAMISQPPPQPPTPVIEEEEDPLTIQEDDHLRGFRFFQNSLDNEAPDPEDIQQESFYEMVLRGERLVVVPETNSQIVAAEPNALVRDFVTIDPHPLDDVEPLVQPNDPNLWYFCGRKRLSRYKGEWKNGKPHGRGIKEIFDGPFRNANGQPCDASGNIRCHSIIDGNFVDSYAEGYGVQYYDITEPDEVSVPYYKGQFHENVHHGIGEYHYGTGSWYKGSFCFSKFHGRAIYYHHPTREYLLCLYENDIRIKSFKLFPSQIIN